VAGVFGAVLAELGVVVVSGLARGIDSAAHEGALVPAGGAAPLAVAGTGVDRVFPAGNERLWARVAEAGGIVSESPPGAPPEGWRFPLRNRIIAALSEVLVVVESSRQGGAMHTVQAADDIGVPVLAVPGSIRSPQSEGTNAVIRDGGAGLAADVDDVLAALALARAGSLEPPTAGAPGGPPPRRTGRGRAGRSSGSGQLSRSRSRARPPISRAEQLLRLCSDSERTVYAALDEVVSTVDAVCQRCGLSLGSVVLALDRLEELGLAAHVGASWVRR
jgi:DNA protecting protein DprA